MPLVEILGIHINFLSYVSKVRTFDFVKMVAQENIFLWHVVICEGISVSMFFVKKVLLKIC